jgi:hypothetical protein
MKLSLVKKKVRRPGNETCRLNEKWNVSRCSTLLIPRKGYWRTGVEKSTISTFDITPF